MPKSKFAKIINQDNKFRSSKTQADGEKDDFTFEEHSFSTIFKLTSDLGGNIGIGLRQRTTQFTTAMGASDNKEVTTTAITEGTTKDTTTSAPIGTINVSKTFSTFESGIQDIFDDIGTETYSSETINTAEVESDISYIKSTTDFVFKPFAVGTLEKALTDTIEGTINAGGSQFTYIKKTVSFITDTVTFSTYRHNWDWFSFNPFSQMPVFIDIRYADLGLALVTEGTDGLDGATSKPFEIFKTAHSYSSFVSKTFEKGTTEITVSGITTRKEIETTSVFNGFSQNFPSPFGNNATIGGLETTYQLKYVVSTNFDFTDTLAAYINTKEETIYNRCSIDWGANSNKFNPEYTGDFSIVRDAFKFGIANTYLPILFPKEVNRGGFKIKFPNDVDQPITASNTADTFIGSYKFENDNLITGTEDQVRLIDFGGAGRLTNNFLVTNFNIWSSIGRDLSNEFKFLGFFTSLFREFNHLSLYKSPFWGADVLIEKYHDKAFTNYSITEKNITSTRKNTRIFRDNSTESFLMGTKSTLKSVGASSAIGFEDFKLIITYETNPKSGTYAGANFSIDALSYNFPIGGIKAQESQFNR